MRTIDSKWIFKIVRDKEGKPLCDKARLCARGFSQSEGIDYTETYSPVIRYDSLRIFLAIVTQLDKELVQFDINAAFLYGELQEDIIMEIPEGLVSNIDKKTSVCKLLKSWYGLKQAARCFNNKVQRAIHLLNLQQCEGDQCIFRGTVNGYEVLLALFVDEGLVASNSQAAIEIVLNGVVP